MLAGFNISARSPRYRGKISGLNVWHHVLSGQEVARMAYGCANEAGNVRSWADLHTGSNIIGRVETSRPATCKVTGGGD